MPKKSDDPPKREFLMLAHTLDIEMKKIPDISGWYWSEKMDGQRAFSDGGLTRGLKFQDVPFANHSKDKRNHECTGLWTRGGKIIHAPEWFLDDLPKTPLDGELWLGRGVGKLQEVMHTTKQETPNDEDWKKIEYSVFESPPVRVFGRPGRIHAGDWEVVWDTEIIQFLEERIDKTVGFSSRLWDSPFEETKEALGDYVRHCSYVTQASQHKLPDDLDKALRKVEVELRRICKAGGEGMMIRNPKSVWEPRRSHGLLKLKKVYDAEATVIGCSFGAETDRGSKLLGLMGALLVRNDEGKEFEIGGFELAERVLGACATAESFLTASEYASKHPGERAPDWIVPASFPIGTRITYTYYDKTKDGIPKYANYFRIRLEE